MTKILSVQALGREIQVDFDNDSTLLIPAERLLSQPGFELMGEDERIFYPHTDGQSIFWRFGPRLTAEELLALLPTTETTDN